MIKLTKAAIQRHIKTGGTECCPFCKADILDEFGDFIIEYTDLDPIEDGTIQQEATCVKCKSKWMDIFALKEIQEL